MKMLFGEEWKLMKYGGRNMFVFELAYKLIPIAVIYPLIILVLNLAIKAAGIRYLTNEYIIKFVTDPVVIGILVVLVICLGCYLLYEMIYISLCYEFKIKNTRASLFENAVTSWDIIKKIFKRKNWMLGPFAVLAIILENTVIVLNTLLGGIPDKLIRDYASKIDVWVWIIIVLAIVAVYTIVIFGCFTINEFVLEGKDFKRSFKKSLQLVKNNFIRVFTTLVIYNLAIIAFIGVVYVILSVVLIAGVNILDRAYMGSAMYLSALRTIRSGVKLVLLLMALPASHTVITRLYYKLCKEDEYQFDPIRVIEKYPRRNRNICIAVFSLAIVLNVTYVISAFNSNPFEKVAVFNSINVTAHRGSSKAAPENTMAAFAKAIDNMTDYIELDVQQTYDNIIIVMHDANALRTTGVDRNIWQMTLEEVKQLDAGSSFSSEYAGEQVPTLDETIKFVKGKAKLNIEIKPNEHDANLAQNVVKVIEDNNFEDDCVITSFNYNILRQIKEINPDIEVGYILSVAYGDFYNMHDIDFFSINASFLTKRTVDAIHSNGKQVHAWTVNNATSMKNLSNKGVDNIITDDPLLAREVIYTRNTSETIVNMIKYVFNR